MLFNFEFNQYRYKNLTSGQVHKLLSALKYPVKKQKLFIKKAIEAYREGRPHYMVKGIPHVAVVPGTATKRKESTSENNGSTFEVLHSDN